MEITKSANLDNVMFEKIKQLQSRELGRASINNILGVHYSESVHSQIRKFSSFNDYIEYNRARRNKYNTRAVADNQENTLNILQGTKSADGTDMTVESFLQDIDNMLNGLRTNVEKVIEMATKQRVDEQMKSIAVELKELRLLRDEAKTNNWAMNLAKKLRG